MRPGSATSADGVHFERNLEPVLPVGNAGDFDALGVAWPRVKPPSNYYTSGSAVQMDGAGQWLLTYHTRERATDERGACYSAGVATSPDGKLWVKQGKVLTRGPEGAWDDRGVSVRHVIQVGNQLIMAYVGSNRSSDYGIGLATSDDGGKTWTKDANSGPEPGGPILIAQEGAERLGQHHCQFTVPSPHARRQLSNVLHGGGESGWGVVTVWHWAGCVRWERLSKLEEWGE